MPALILALLALAPRAEAEERAVEDVPASAEQRVPPRDLRERLTGARGREPLRETLGRAAIRAPAYCQRAVRDRSSRPPIRSFRASPRTATTGCCSRTSSRASSSTHSGNRSRCSSRLVYAGTATSRRRRLTGRTTGTSSAARCGCSRETCSEAAWTSISAGSISKTIACGGGIRSSTPCDSSGTVGLPRRLGRRWPRDGSWARHAPTAAICPRTKRTTSASSPSCRGSRP